ncbi:MAG: permease [Alphaproteobacteria bacterium]|nr:permease [Alphaproteobacteria bacterium]NNF24876.1 hypothetical protein [Paracoccaceae bacterium]
MNAGFVVLLALLLGLLGLALRRGEDFGPVTQRFIEQFAMLVPRMLCALVAAGFIAQLIPKEAIARLLGEDAGILAIPIAAVTGLLVPAGPVIAFAIAAVFAKSGASTPALVTFVTSWSIFAAHRILIYEIPLLGPSFLRLRIVSAAAVPFLAGLLAMLAGMITSYGVAVPLQ